MKAANVAHAIRERTSCRLCHPTDGRPTERPAKAEMRRNGSLFHKLGLAAEIYPGNANVSTGGCRPENPYLTLFSFRNTQSTTTHTAKLSASAIERRACGTAES